VTAWLVLGLGMGSGLYDGAGEHGHAPGSLDTSEAIRPLMINTSYAINYRSGQASLHQTASLER